MPPLADVATSDLLEVQVDEDGNVVGGVTRSSLRREAAEAERQGWNAAPTRVALARSRRDPAALKRLLDGGWTGDQRLGTGDRDYVLTVWVAPRARPQSTARPTLRRPRRARPRGRRARRSASRGSPGRRGDDPEPLALTLSGRTR